jgi:hypothetical protein
MTIDHDDSHQQTQQKEKKAMWIFISPHVGTLWC